QRATFDREVLEALPLGAEPVAVERVVDRAHERAEPLASTPVVDVALADVVVARDRRADVAVALVFVALREGHERALRYRYLRSEDFSGREVDRVRFCGWF